MRSYADAPSVDPLLHSLVFGLEQLGAAAGATRGPITIGWGRRDRVCLPRQTARALQRFAGARMHRFERCGHFPYWDQPAEATRLILQSTGASARNGTTDATEAPTSEDATTWQAH